MWPAPFYLQLAESSWMSKGKKALPGANPIPQGAGPIQKRECRPAEDSSTCHRKETRETLAMGNSIFPELGTQQVLLHNGRILFCFITKNIFQNIRELEIFHGDPPNHGEWSKSRGKYRWIWVPWAPFPCPGTVHNLSVPKNSRCSLSAH